MVSEGSFHKSIRASGGSKPRDASATNPPVDLTPATMPTTAAKITHPTAITRFICLNLMIPHGTVNEDGGLSRSAHRALARRHKPVCRVFR